MLLVYRSDVQPIAAAFNPALKGRERLPTSEELAPRFGGDPEHPSFIPAALVAPGPAELKVVGTLGAKLLGMMGDTGTAKAISLLGASTPEFANMFKGSKLVDEAGNPQRLFHGSTGDIEKFDLQLANPESDWGAGIYLTNSVDDVNANYAGFGPDLTNRLEFEVERLQGNLPQFAEDVGDENLIKLVEDSIGKSLDDASQIELDKALRGIAREKFESINEGQITPLFAAVENPVVVGGAKETRFDIEFSNPFYDSVEDAMKDPSLSGLSGDDLFNQAEDLFQEGMEESGPLLDFAEAIRKNAHKYDEFDVDRFIDDVFERADFESISAQDIHGLAGSSEGIIYATNDSGQLVSKEIIREAFEDMGFDGIIDRTVNDKFGTARRTGQQMAGMDEDTIHVIAFDPDKLNTAFAGENKLGIGQ